VKAAVRRFPRGGTSSGIHLRPQTSARHDAARQVIGLEEKRPAGSARTRRSVGNSRRRPRIRSVRCIQGNTQGAHQYGNLIVRRDDFVKHTTSPSHRDRSQQVVIPDVSQIASATSDLSIRSDGRRVPQSVRTPRPLLRVRRRWIWLVRISLASNRTGRDAPPEKFRHRTTALILL